MRFLVDAQLPPALARWLEGHGHLAEHVADVSLESAKDSDIWAYAERHAAIIVSKDEDFARLAGSGKRTARVVWLRIGNTTRRELLQWMQRAWPRISAGLDNENEQVVEVIAVEQPNAEPSG